MIQGFSGGLLNRELIYQTDLPSFQRDFASLKTLDHGTGPAITFTRGTNATFFDANGTLRFAPHNAIRNSQAGGSTNGVIGSGGVMPLNWSISPPDGVDSEIIGTGTEDGLSYIDIKISGTPTAGGAMSIRSETITQVVASNGQTWTGSLYCKLQSGSLTNASLDIRTDGLNAIGIPVFGQREVVSIIPTSAALKTQRVSSTRTMSSASVQRVSTAISVGYTSGQPIDLTLRIAAPQLEQNATASEYIPTTGTANFDQPRFDHSSTGSSLGLLIEEARTNSIRNSQAGGAVAGSPGTVPTNWVAAATSNGLSREIVATGTVNGLAYIDIKWSGTTTANSGTQVHSESPTQVPATAGDTWTTSAYVQLVGGTLSGVTFAIQNWYHDNAGVFIGFNQTSFTPTSSLLRVSHAGAVVATATRIRNTLQFFYGSGQAVDFTLRIAAPQLEQGAFATSYIPTTTAAATRSADFARVTPISGFYNQSEGSVFAEFSKFQMVTNSKVFLFFDPLNAGRYAGFENDGGTPTTNRFIVQNDAGSTVANISFTSAAANTIYRNAGGYALDNFNAAQNGTLGSQDNSGTPASSLTHVGIGCLPGSGNFPLNGHIRKIAYWPRRLSNTLLEQLTT
jgi:hypothetical protein